MCPKSQAQAAFLGVVHVAVEDKSVDTRFASNLMPRVAVGCRLQGLALRTLRGVEALLAEDYPSSASLKLEFGLP